MFDKVLLGSLFVVTFLTHASFWFVMRAFSSGAGNYFRYQAPWMILKSSYYGLIVVALAFVLLQACEHFKCKSIYKVVGSAAILIVAWRWAGGQSVLPRADEIVTMRLGRIIDNLSLAKSTLWHGRGSSAIGCVTDIHWDPVANSFELAGTSGAIDFDSQARVGYSVRFDGQSERTLAFKNKIGKRYFLNRGSWANTSSLFDEHGKMLWTSPGYCGTDDATAIDFEGNGDYNIAVGYNGDGLSLYSLDGKRIWNRPVSLCWHVEAVGPDEDGHYRLVDSADALTVRDSKGNITSRNNPTTYVSDFSVFRYPRDGKDRAIWIRDGVIGLCDLNGTWSKTIAAPDAGNLADVRAIAFRARRTEPDFLAILISMRPDSSRSVLLIYDSDFNLQYKESLPSQCLSIAVQPGKKEDCDSLLIGGENKLWRYQP